MNGSATAAAASTSAQANPSTNGTTPTAQQVTLEAPNERVDVIDHAGGRILCVADIRGRISKLNELAKEHKAVAIIHTGDFGFYDKESIERISDRTLRHLVQYSQLIEPAVREKHFPIAPPSQALSLGQLREKLLNPSEELLADQKGVDFILSEFPKLLNGEIKLDVPVYSVWGACEDIAILEKIRLATQSPSSSQADPAEPTSKYAVPNLTVLSEGVTRCVVIGGVKLRLFGLGGSIVPHKFFDNGEGNATMAGGNGTMWTTALQLGELLDTAQKVFDPTETRLLITHASPGREGLLAQLALAIKADFTLSASLHFRYGSSYNDFSTQTDTEGYRSKYHQANKTFMEVYESVKNQVESVIDDQQKQLLKNALAIAARVPQENVEEPAWKNSWNWNLPDALYGSLILDIKDGRVGSELKSTGFNFAYRLKSNAGPVGHGAPHGQSSRNIPPNKPPAHQHPASGTTTPALPGSVPNGPKAGTPSSDAFHSAAKNAFSRPNFGRGGAVAGGQFGSGGRGRGNAHIAQHVAGSHQQRPRDTPSPAGSAANASTTSEKKEEVTSDAATSKLAESSASAASAVKNEDVSIAPDVIIAPTGETSSTQETAPRPPFQGRGANSSSWRDRDARKGGDSAAESSGGENRGEGGFRGGRGGGRGRGGPPREGFSPAPGQERPSGSHRGSFGRGRGDEEHHRDGPGGYRGRGRGSDRGRGSGRGFTHRAASSGEVAVDRTSSAAQSASPSTNPQAPSKPAEAS